MKRNDHYHPLTKFLHWGILVLVSIQFLTSFVMSGLRRSSSPDFFMSVHMSFGVFIAPLALILLIMRLTQPVEKIRGGPAWQIVASQIMHYLLYILLLVVPMSGYAYASSKGAVVRVFGLFDLPTILPSGSSLVRTLGEIHPFLAWTIGTLVLGHILAALYHHYVLKDKVLTRMLPEKKAGSDKADIQ